MNWLFIFLGGGSGSLLRYLMQLALPGTSFPWGTLVANVAASILLGFIAVSDLSTQWKLMLAIGFCGGLSTFSTFSLETVRLAQQNQWMPVFLNILLNMGVCFLAIYILSKKS